MNTRLLPRKSLISCILFAGICFLVVIISLHIWDVYRSYQGAQVWDMASHTLAGAKFFQDLRHGSVLQFFKDINGLKHWPFFHGLLLSFLFFFTGIRDETAVFLSLLSYGLSVLFIFWILRTILIHEEVDPLPSREVSKQPETTFAFQISRDFLWGIAGFIPSFLALFSPEFSAYGAVVMLEMFGVMVTLFCFWMYILYLKINSSCYLTATALGTAALIFTKYNYGIMWLVPFLIFQGLIFPKEKWYLLWKNVSFYVRRGLRNPFVWGTVLVALALITVTHRGGYQMMIAGHRVRIMSPWNGLWLLAFLWSLWFLVRFWRDSSFRSFLLQPGLKPFVIWVLFPCLIWFLWTQPNRLGNVAGFLESRKMKSSILSWNNLWTYPKEVWKLYHVNLWFLSVSLFFFLVAAFIAIRCLRKYWRNSQSSLAPPDPILFLFLYFGINMVAVIAHHTTGSRFFITIMPVYWLLSGYGLFWALRTISREWVRWVGGGGLLVGLLLSGWENRVSFFDRGVVSMVERNYSRGEIPQALDWIVQRVRQSSHKVLVVGYCNELSLHLIDLEVLKWGGLSSSQKIYDHKGQWEDWSQQNLLLSSVLREKGIDWVLVIEIQPGTRYDTLDYRSYFRQQLTPVDKLKKDPSVHREGFLRLQTLVLEAYHVL